MLCIETRKAYLANGECVQVCHEQLTVRKVEPRRLHGSGDQFRLIFEEVAIVWRVARAVRKDECALSAPTGTARPLRIVRRIRRGVAHVDDAEAADVNSELHRRR